MKAARFRASIVAYPAVTALLAISASPGGVVAESDTSVLKIVETQNVDFSTVVALPTSEEVWIFLEDAPAIMDALLKVLRMDCLVQAGELLDTVGEVGIDIDGKIHINMMVWDNWDSLDLNLHLSARNRCLNAV